MYATSKNQVRLAALLALLALLPATSHADVVLDWNRVASNVLRDNTSLQNPGMASRSLAMMNLAIYDAIAMTSPGASMFYDYGGGHGSPGYGYSDKAAAAQAAYTVMSSLYADQQTQLDAALSTSLSLIPNTQAKTDGVALGWREFLKYPDPNPNRHASGGLGPASGARRAIHPIVKG